MSIKEEKKDSLSFIRSQEVKELLELKENESFKNILIDVFKRLRKRDFLSVDGTLKEIEGMEIINIQMSDFRATNTDFRSLMELLGKLDNQKTRLSDFLADAQNDCDVIETWNKELRDIWISKSKGKSIDKREGEATEILLFLTNEKLVRRGLLNKIKNRFNAVASKMDAVSREITIGQELRKNNV